MRTQERVISIDILYKLDYTHGTIQLTKQYILCTADALRGPFSRAELKKLTCLQKQTSLLTCNKLLGYTNKIDKLGLLFCFLTRLYDYKLHGGIYAKQKVLDKNGPRKPNHSLCIMRNFEILSFIECSDDHI